MESRKTEAMEHPGRQSAGIYIHIPYCKRKCSYCNFHFSTNTSTKSLLLEALKKEFLLRSETARHYKIETLYFGGGTPSLLNPEEWEALISTLRREYDLEGLVECTVEINPDDLDQEYVRSLQSLGCNRLSIGVQSFDDTDLSWMNRAHSARQSRESIEIALSEGFANISIDLMYGLPGGSRTRWLSNLQIALDCGIPHLSCYALTLEERTSLHHQVKHHRIGLPEDVDTVEQMDLFLDFCAANGYEAYEISNAARPGFRSRHNSGYWNGQPYLGFGPSAHSYDGWQRSWNIANNNLYIQAVEHQLPFSEKEVLTEKDRYNEWIMLQLRRMEGLSLKSLEQDFPQYYTSRRYLFDELIEQGFLSLDEGHYRLSRKGRHIADEVSSQLFE